MYVCDFSVKCTLFRNKILKNKYMKYMYVEHYWLFCPTDQWGGVVRQDSPQRLTGHQEYPAWGGQDRLTQVTHLSHLLGNKPVLFR